MYQVWKATILTIGLGKELCAKFLLRSHHVVIAAVRDPSSDSSMKLAHMRRHDTSKLIVLQIDSTSKSDPFTLVRALETEYGILWLDVVIANAGISKYFGEVRITPAEEMFAHYEVNVVAPLLLFQATAPLLDASPGHAKFITISSGAGSISGMENLPIANTAYGSSKTALNFVTRKMHFENPNLIAFSINPGWLKTSVRLG